MLIHDQERFAPTPATLKDNRVVTLRFLAIEDAERLGDFYLSIERAAYRFYCPHPLTREQAAKKVAMAFAPTSGVLVAENETQEIVGYASYWWNADDEKPSIFGICITQAYRGIALGQALMARLFEIAEKVGPPVMSLTVQKANPRAFALYSKMGFQVVREQMRKQVEEFPPEPEYYMERPAR